MIKVLVTGFGAYTEAADNPSGVIAARLNDWQGSGVRIHGLLLPATSAGVGPSLAEAIERVRPDAVLLTGVTPGRAAVTIERIAINVQDFPIPDNDGAAPIDVAVVPGGPDAYFSTLPIKAILAAWRSHLIPSSVSNTAGTYVCNQTFYLARHLTEGRGVIAGLVHIPLASSSAAGVHPPPPSLDLDLLAEAVRIAAVVAATHRGPDVSLGAGTTG